MCGGVRFVKYRVGKYDNVFPKGDVLYNLETDLYLKISNLIAQEKFDELNVFREEQMAAARQKATGRTKYVTKEQVAEIMRAVKMTEGN